MKNKRGSYRTRISKYGMREREFSPELRAKMKENSRINDKYIEYVNFVRTTEDQYLVSNIINHPIMTV